MKKLYIVSMVGVAFALGSAWGDVETIDGYKWSYRINGDEAEIYKGSSAAISPKPTGLVTIPSTLGGKPVTRIGAYAFSGCSGMTWVTIPDDVTSIGRNAFYGCSGLTSMLISDSVTNIGERAFYNCGKLTVATIGNDVTRIEDLTFCGCKYLASIAIPDNVTNIGTHAFYNCSKLSVVTIGAGVTRVGDRAFSKCRGLVEFVVVDDNPAYKSVSGLLLTKDGRTLVAGINGDVVIPSGVMAIGSRAFSGCRGLTSVVIPDSVKRIEGGAFSGCTGLTSVVIPDGVTYIADDAFDGCSGLAVYYGGVVDDVQFGKVQTKVGALYDAVGGLVGTVELKFGRANSKTGAVRVSASASLLVNGAVKKVTAKAITIKDGDADKVLAFRAPIGEMAFSMAADGSFTLESDAYKMLGAVSDGVTDAAPRVVSVGGTLAKEQLTFNVTVDGAPDVGKDGELLEAAFPKNVPVRVSGGTKWSCAKAAIPKYKKNAANGTYEPTGLDDPARPNLSGLKLIYTPKTGLFKGTFKLYATNAATTPEGRLPKLKKFTVNVVGFVVDGVGYGWATKERQGVAWPVYVE